MSQHIMVLGHQQAQFWLNRQTCFLFSWSTQQWRHNEHDGDSNHQPHDCLLNRLFRRRSKKTSTLHNSGLCVGNSPVTGEFPIQKSSKMENVSIWWHHWSFAGLQWFFYTSMDRWQLSKWTTKCHSTLSVKTIRLTRFSLKFVPRDPIDNIQHWFRWYSAPSHYLNQCWPSSLTHICGTRGILKKAKQLTI